MPTSLLQICAENQINIRCAAQMEPNGLPFEAFGQVPVEHGVTIQPEKNTRIIEE